MKIRMLTGISGLDFTLVPKEETDRFSDGEALRLMLSDQAEPVDETSQKALARAIAERDDPSEATTAAPPPAAPPAAARPRRAARS